MTYAHRLTRSASESRDKKSKITLPRSSSNDVPLSAKVYRIADSTVARVAGLGSLMRPYSRPVSDYLSPIDCCDAHVVEAGNGLDGLSSACPNKLPQRCELFLPDSLSSRTVGSRAGPLQSPVDRENNG